jgi:hypothetical protein
MHAVAATVATYLTLKAKPPVPAAGATTANLQTWIKGNVIPLMILIVAVSLFLLARSGSNAKAMRVVGGVLIAVAVLGLAATGKADHLGTWALSLIGV